MLEATESRAANATTLCCKSIFNTSHVPCGTPAGRSSMVCGADGSADSESCRFGTETMSIASRRTSNWRSPAVTAARQSGRRDRLALLPPRRFVRRPVHGDHRDQLALVLAHLDHVAAEAAPVIDRAHIPGSVSTPSRGTSPACEANKSHTRLARAEATVEATVIPLLGGTMAIVSIAATATPTHHATVCGARGK